MKKVSLLSMLIAMFLLSGNMMAQEVLINENFETYSINSKLAEEASENGNDWWTTWSGTHGNAEDGEIKYFDRTNCAYFVRGIDQVLLLGGYESGVYELSFDIYIPDGKSAYFNVLHSFNGGGSTYALQNYLHMTSNGSGATSHAEGHGTVHAGGKQVADVPCVYDAWMHFRLYIDTDTDVAEYYYTAPGGEEQLLCTWQWSLDSFGENTVGRKLDAMNFYVPEAGSEFYLDNLKLIRTSESYAEIAFNKEAINVEVEKNNEVKTVDVNIENQGSSIAEWNAWVDFPLVNNEDKINVLAYDQDPFYTVCSGMGYTEPTVIELGVMYPLDYYVGQNALGTRIKQVMYFVGTAESTGNIGIEPGTPLKFRIYGQGMYGQPGELIVEKEIPADQIVIDNWNIVEFEEPIALSGYNVWATVEFVHAVGGKPITSDGTAGNIPYSDMFRENGAGTFRSFSDIATTSYGCLHISMTTVGVPEKTEPWAYINKNENTIPAGASDNVTLTLDPSGMKDGKYEADLVFLTNDTEKTRVEIPITLAVGEVSLEENVNNAYNIYPNPTSGLMTIEAENISYIAIYNSTGQLVNVVKGENNTIDMSGYDNGVYYFNIVDNAGNKSIQRVVVAK